MSASNVTKVSSKITSKNQITVPKTVRELLKVQSADTIEWQIEPSGKVMIVRSKPDLWHLVDEQEKKFGNLSTTEVDWGKDVESEDFD
ncbi:type II toxin-antitoxin system PrlF family antitoxin [Lactobacillus sp. UCMA15818]|uniref:type II toxin-antitoxin system PrlF family antitoxin n=1 Tax=Lactobacillus sp. UCMA15818 TaxID=2583394 RepID=UPI0025B19C23|nr:type II toxin-antitoxin system PrlF family antitoxin [Lactobacillus sp. UCMA15818]MDN2452985.1 AbrB family transcriptional regulator [Lactobacillus sp. UCMA15818]